jgi:outer membrane protein assembly factor BamB
MMKRRTIIAFLIPAAVALAGSTAIAWWLRIAAAPVVELRVPGTDGAAAAGTGVVAAVRGELTRGEGQPSTQPGEWPQFRGPARDGVAQEGAGWATNWPAAGPRVVWSIPVGEGHAGAAVWQGRVYLFDYDRDRHRDVIRCLSLDDARDIWRYSYPVDIKRNHGMSRTVPAVTNGLLVALGPKCHVTALDPVTGERHWGLDLVRDYGTTVPPWYAGQCPLIDEGRVILAPGGTALLLAVDGLTGTVAWTTPNPRGWKMTHSSIMPVVLGGRRQYVYCASDGVVAVSPEDGSVLWTSSEWKISIANIPTPVVVGPNRLLLAGGYNAGAVLLEVQGGATGCTARVVTRYPATVFGADQQTPIRYNNSIYGVRPGGELVCLDLDGTLRWTSGAENRYGIGPYVVAGDRLLVMNDAGRLTMVRAAPDGFTRMAEAQVLHGHDAWGPMAVAGDRLIVRDLTTLTCLDMSGR